VGVYLSTVSGLSTTQAAGTSWIARARRRI
jgi:hypothetical protein